MKRIAILVAATLLLPVTATAQAQQLGQVVRAVPAQSPQDYVSVPVFTSVTITYAIE